jgi:hypothetical protein
MKLPFTIPFFTTPIYPYEYNRPMTPFEKAGAISQKTPSPCPPWYQLAVIKMNSTFLECTDKWYAEKGTIAGPLLVLNAAFLVMMFFAPIVVLIQFPGLSAGDRVSATLVALFAVFGCGSVLWIGKYFFQKEFFRYTHYPVRFNRKTRKVYLFRSDGTVMVEDWDKLFFFVGVTGMNHDSQEVLFHRLAEDRETVLDTFALPSHDNKNSPYVFALWEFVRHYMEKGPADLVKNVPFINDVADRKETFWGGFHALQAAYGSYAVLWLIGAPISLWFAVGRWISMRTCKIPVWPDEIEAQCQIEPNDPYIRDRDHLADIDKMEMPEGSHLKQVQERRLGRRRRSYRRL